MPREILASSIWGIGLRVWERMSGSVCGEHEWMFGVILPSPTIGVSGLTHAGV